MIEEQDRTPEDNLKGFVAHNKAVLEGSMKGKEQPWAVNGTKAAFSMTSFFYNVVPAQYERVGIKGAN